MSDGWIKLHRQIEENWIWQDKPFTKGQAWIDILLQCNHEPQKVNMKNSLIFCDRGESLKSLDTWAQRWGWTKSKVRRFLKLLDTDKMIEIIKHTANSETQTTHHNSTFKKKNSNIDTPPVQISTHLKVINYNIYQSARNTDETQMKRKRNTSETQTTLNKNERNEKNEKYKEEYAEFVKMTIEEFDKLVGEYGHDATKKMIERLDNYKGSSGKKYKSDYRAILSWVVDEIVKKHPKLDLPFLDKPEYADDPQ